MVVWRELTAEIPTLSSDLTLKPHVKLVSMIGNSMLRRGQLTFVSPAMSISLFVLRSLTDLPTIVMHVTITGTYRGVMYVVQIHHTINGMYFWTGMVWNVWLWYATHVGALTSVVPLAMSTNQKKSGFLYQQLH